MTLCTPSADLFPACKSRKIDARFDGGEITSDAGLLLLRQADKKLKLTRQAARCLPDARRKKSCKHSLHSLLAQRVYGLAAGYEDLNDHDELRHDLLLQSVIDQDEALASPATLCRFENAQGREAAWAIHQLLFEHFVSSYDEPPEELVLDFDATDDPVHGEQAGRFFHGYYDHYCFLPLYVFCGSHLLVSYLRPSNIDGAKHAWAILSLLVKRLREKWPDVRIVFRADSGFCRWRMLRWMERNNVDYLVGLAKNKRLKRRSDHLIEKAALDYEVHEKAQRVIGSITYAAKSWDRKRRVLVRALHDHRGSNPRYVVTNLKGRAKALYESYCLRGDMENRIKEQQMYLFSDRTSASRWWANQFRVLLSSLAYTLIDHLRIHGLKDTELAQAQCHTIRLKLFKIGAVLTRNTRRVRLHLSSTFPRQDLFWRVAYNLAAS